MTVARQMQVLLGLVVASLSIVVALSLFGFARLGGEIDTATKNGALRAQLIDTARSAQVDFQRQVQEWKNILLRGNAANDFDKYQKGFNARADKVQAQLRELAKLMETAGMPEQPALALLADHAEMLAKYREALKSFDQANPDSGHVVDKLVHGIDRQTSSGMDKLVKAIGEFAEANAAQLKQSADNERASIRNLFLIVVVMAVPLIGFIGLRITSSLLSQLGGEPAYAVQVVRQVADGELTIAVATKPGDTSSLLAAIKTMQQNLKDMIGQVHQGAMQVSAEAGALSVTTDQVAAGSQRQSEAASSMAAAVEQMTVSLDQVAEHARDAQTHSGKSAELSTSGGEVIHQVVGDMRKIADSVNASSQIIQQLGQQSDQIFSIVNVIKDIADQTNLLALNAAIEAARAGEQGRGFAVVADEVRKLAERTANSTQEIAGMITKIQSGTKSAVASMEAGVSVVNQGVALANQAGESIEQIKSGSQQVGSTVNDITSAIREQSHASADIAHNVEHVAQMSEQNSAAVQQAAYAAHRLEGLAGNLKHAVSRFRV